MTDPQQPYGPSGYGPSGYGPRPGPTETEPKAVVALVLAVLTWTPIVPFIGAVAALVLVKYARRDIARSGGAKTGLGLARAAKILSIVHLVLVALVAVGILLLLLLLLLGVGLGQG